MTAALESFSWKQRKLLVKRAIMVMILAMVVGLVVPMAVGAANGNFIEDIIGDGNDEVQNVTVSKRLEKRVTKNINDFATIVYGQQSWNKNEGEAVDSTWSNDRGYAEMLAHSEWFDNIWGILVGIGGAMITFYAFVEVMRELEKGTCDFDMWLRMFTKITIGVFVIANVPQLTSWMDQLGCLISEGLCGALKDAAKAIAENAPESWQEALAGGIFGVLSKILAKGKYYLNSALNGLWGLGAFAMDKGFEIGMKAFAYGILLELFVRKAFMPIACARVCGEGWQSAGMRNLKKYMSVNLRAAVIMVIYAAGDALLVMDTGWAVSTTLRALTPHFIVRGAIKAAVLALAGQAQPLADEIIGVDR